jgi:hypothetical protein
MSADSPSRCNIAGGYRPPLQLGKTMLRKSIFAVIVLFSSLALLAQDRPQPQKQAPFSISVEALEVDLPISILDKEGRPVDGL